MRFGTFGKVGISWYVALKSSTAVIVAAGIYGFYLSKTDITTKRVEHMQVRERIRASNTGEYEASPRKYAN